MYRKSTKDPAASIVTAAIGAGLVAAFCVSQGQSLGHGILVTAFATVVALVIDGVFFKG